MNEAFIQARRMLMQLMNPSQLRAACVRYLQEGGELDEADAMQNCSIEYGEVRCQRGSVYEIDVTLRCKREWQEKLKPRTFVFSSEDIAGPELMSRLTEAMNESLPSGYRVANAEARAISGAPGPAVVNRFPAADDEAYNELTGVSFLTSLGRGAVDGLLMDFVPDLELCGLSLPKGKLSDADYLSEVAKALRCEERLPVELRGRIAMALRTFRLNIPVQEREVSQESDGVGISLRLVKSETGRGLMRILMRCLRMHHDFTETLTHAQAEISSGFLDHVHACFQGFEEVDPDDREQTEHSITERLQKLGQSGLQVFAGTFGIRFWNTEYECFPGKVAVVTVVSRDDPRIRMDEGGMPYIDGVISNSGSPRSANGGVKSPRRVLTTPDLSEPRLEKPSGMDGQAIASKPRNQKLSYRRAGEVWEVVWEGSRPFLLQNTLGARYLDYLLHHPGTTISAYDLEVMITPEKANLRTKSSIQLKSDPEATRSYLREVARLRARRDEAAAESQLGEVDQLDGEIAELEEAMEKGDLAGDTGERARGNVSKAIRGLQQKLLEGSAVESAFARHIKDCVSMGYSFSYSHPRGETWL